MTTARKILIGLIALVVLIACAVIYFIWFYVRIEEYPVPVRADIEVPYKQQDSIVVSSVSLPMNAIRRGLEKDVPRKLVSINERVDDCVPRETVRIFKQNLFRTPRFGCDLVGEIRRGSITFAQGRGSTLSARMPINATIEIRNIGDVIKRETATATAIVTMRARLGIGRRWQLQPNIDLSYEWFEEPGIDFMGQRIRFTKQADRELAKILPQIERQLAAQIASTNVRPEVEKLWRQAFTVESINREDPPVWMRLSPNGAGVGTLQVGGNRLSLDVMLRANAELFVGDEPNRPEPTALPANMGIPRGSGYSLTVPVLADYDQVEPVILRALKRLAERGIERGNLGRLDVSFENVEVYATERGRIAVGIDAVVEPIGNITGRIWGRSRGTIWLTAEPISKPGSEIIRVRGLEVYGDMDRDVGDLLVRVIASDEVRTEIEDALVEDFQKDYQEILDRARKGLRTIKVGSVTLSFGVDSVEHGTITPTGQGLFMPVSATGSARISIPVR
ncbi:DUF4403 family protein [uncultured Erythrobacter sp.]|uniref:DUF4403 family protein n=1 Tax=uncultured Erythrobacter sp. TaxID=263913 RepID=UPI002619C021|nr:DUF4403 family protein [uncultured Erythrobacter sp.]